MNFLHPDWPAPRHVHAAMTTRAGGVSEQAFHSLNLGVGSDDPAQVAENRRRVAEALQLPSEPRWLQQVHGAHVVRLAPSPPQGDLPPSPPRSPSILSPSPPRSPSILSPSPPRSGGEGRGEGVLPEADASFTTDPNVVCVVQAADCLPVLFCDDDGQVVAAAHAGWRGLAAGVLEQTVAALPVRPATLMAWLGAAIGPHSFEVGPEVREAFLRVDPGAAAAFTPRPSTDRFLADLYALARQRLAAAGVHRVCGGGRDTLRERPHFFSYRRDGRCGRMAALIWLGPRQESRATR